MLFQQGFSENINCLGSKMSYLGQSTTESKSQRASSTKNSIQSSGSNVSNGIYVDLGKALLEAAKSGDAEKVQECIKNGAPFITDWLGTSALHIACKNNFFDTCATLLRSGISKDAKTKVDRTPLHFAVNEGNFEICQLLIQHECSVDPLDMLRMSPLHWAVEKGHDNIAELLIENGANPHIQSKFLKSPYSIAREKNNEFVLNLIESLPTTPSTPNLASAFDSSVFIKTPTSKNAPNGGLQGLMIKDEPLSFFNEMPSKRARFHSYDSIADSKRLRATDTNTLRLLQEQMNMMSNAADDNNIIQSALQSGRKILLSEAGKRLLNDSALNKFLKIPLNTTISSSPTNAISMLGKNTSPRATASSSQRRTSDSSSDVLEVFRDGKKSNSDILNLIRSSATDLQEVTITQRPTSKPSTPISSIQKTGVSLSAITVPKAKAQSVANHKTRQQHQQLPSSINDISVDLRTTSSSLTSATTDDFSKPEVIGRKYSELFNNYQQLKRAFEREQQKSEGLHRQLSQFQSNFDTYKKQQQEKFESILFLLQNVSTVSGNGDSRRLMSDDVL